MHGIFQTIVVCPQCSELDTHTIVTYLVLMSGIELPGEVEVLCVMIRIE